VVIAPALYAGTLRHRRLLPRRHEFQYPLFMSLLDVDGIEASMAVSRCTSFNRFNWMSYDDRDHLPGHAGTLRERLAACADAHGVVPPDGPVYLLTHLRYAGYVFNPISIYFCCDRAGGLQQVMADVRNTYGGRRQYWLADRGATAQRFAATVPKTLYVSPFMVGDMDYQFVITPPADTLVVHMNVNERGSARRHFDATLSLSAQPWTAAGIRAALARYPFMTARVMGAIHWEALRLRWKRFPETSPPAPS
jgi:uncharacterized protein